LRTSVRFYKDVLGLEIVYGGERSYFTSLRTKDGDTILNLEHGNASIQWGRLIFHVSDVDRFWAYLMEKGFHPDNPHDASWGERYFHMPDPDGHELSFARPLATIANRSARN
jgi:catechol 2,3-dioxygenase-like lactoylglutathione lyase family enzyme